MYYTIRLDIKNAHISVSEAQQRLQKLQAAREDAKNFLAGQQRVVEGDQLFSGPTPISSRSREQAWKTYAAAKFAYERSKEYVRQAEEAFWSAVRHLNGCQEALRRAGGKPGWEEGYGAPKPTAQSRPAGINLEEFVAFHKAMDAVFTSIPDMKAFPKPLAAPCDRVSCAASAGNRSFKACECNLRELFSGFPQKQLKVFLTKYHPDKFSSAPEEIRESCKGKAEEIFKVIQALITA